MTPESLEVEASRVIRNYTLWAGGWGLIPIPAVDFLGTWALQVLMLERLAKVYRVPFSRHRTCSVVSGLLGGLAGTELSYGSLRYLLRAVPVAGPALAVATGPAVTGTITYALGKTFATHFACGGNLLSMKPGQLRAHFLQELERAKREGVARDEASPVGPASDTGEAPAAEPKPKKTRAKAKRADAADAQETGTAESRPSEASEEPVKAESAAPTGEETVKAEPVAPTAEEAVKAEPAAPTAEEPVKAEPVSPTAKETVKAEPAAPSAEETVKAEPDAPVSEDKSDTEPEARAESAETEHPAPEPEDEGDISIEPSEAARVDTSEPSSQAAEQATEVEPRSVVTEPDVPVETESPEPQDAVEAEPAVTEPEAAAPSQTEEETASVSPAEVDPAKKDLVVKAFWDRSYRELAQEPIWALRGVSDVDGKLLADAFRVTTIEDLANLSFAARAREIVDVAEVARAGQTVDEAVLSDIRETYLVSDRADTPIEQLPREPLTVLKGIGEERAAAMAQAFNVKTLAKLASLKFVAWSQRILALADAVDTGE
ncbi:DUF697 domain-containing protein [Sulfidibacter corallicola]|uniref:DUF697 domain-containing protein n=1 Tax=Sulfidibacter corallicola TaxID=2818388 RepID=A0A8A4TXJ1_SULCO|nr:DUF697 domain-containing protein [Sulfidibacter corallicola]QTD51235.1 DUF697 domain-containing protein [Sulfidibacter corallicola]